MKKHIPRNVLKVGLWVVTGLLVLLVVLSIAGYRYGENLGRIAGYLAGYIDYVERVEKSAVDPDAMEPHSFWLLNYPVQKGYWDQFWVSYEDGQAEAIYQEAQMTE